MLTVISSSNAQENNFIQKYNFIIHVFLSGGVCIIWHDFKHHAPFINTVNFTVLDKLGQWSMKLWRQLQINFSKSRSYTYLFSNQYIFLCIRKVPLSFSQTRHQILISQSTVLWNFLYNKTNPIVVIEGNILLSEKYLRLSVTRP